MRKKLLIGMLGMTIVAIVAGDYLFDRSSGAQDSPKKASADTKANVGLPPLEPSPKDVVLPPLPSNSGAPPVPAPKDSFPGFPSFPPNPGITAQGFGDLPPMPRVDNPKKSSESTHKKNKQDSMSQGNGASPLPIYNPPFPVIPAGGNNNFAPVPVNSMPPEHLNQHKPRVQVVPAKPGITTPQEPPLDKPGHSPEPKKNEVKPPVGLPGSFGQGADTPPAPPVQPRLTPPPGPIRLKNSPWSLHVDVVNEQTIVTATVNKKHEFKITCQHLDLQTTHCILKASGKVQINSDALQASCETLAISLYEDRLLLEGKTEVRIRKNPSNGDAKSGVFELSGEVLSLRISELQSAKFIETNMPNTQSRNGQMSPYMQQAVVNDLVEPRGVQTATASDAKKWSPYGKLSRTDMTHDGLSIWTLEDNNGQAIIRFVARGNLSAYEGRTISVLCTAIDKSMLRVTHIAVP